MTTPLWDLIFRTYRTPGVIPVPAKLCMRWLLDDAGALSSRTTAVHATHLTDADVGYFDSRARVSPPLRQQRDRDALREALAGVPRPATLQASGEWQLSQVLSLAMCVAFLPEAVVPSWHEKQVPSTCAWSTSEAGFHAATTWHDSQVEDELMCVVGLPPVRMPSNTPFSARTPRLPAKRKRPGKSPARRPGFCYVGA